MEIFRKNELLTIEENLLALIDSNDTILRNFQIALLDHQVINLESANLFISKYKLFIIFDETIEVYDLSEADLYFSGEYPKFTLLQSIVEQPYKYSNDFTEDLLKMRQDEDLLKVTISESKQMPKDFLLRDGIFIQKGYQNWAFGIILKNIQRGQESEEILDSMIKSSFTMFNAKTILMFAFITLVFFLIKLLFGSVMPDVVSVIFNVIYSLIVFFMGVWLYLTMNKMFKKYYTVFASYTLSEDKQVE